MDMLDDARGRTGERAVSPVIGIILMVAITVILTAVIAAFALGFADETGSSAPQISLESDYNESGANVVTLTVQGGDSFDAESVEFEGDVDSAEDWTDANDINDGDSVSAGDSIDIDVAGPDYVVELVWQADDGGESSIIRTLEGPEA
jgi:flagellin-like protein